MKPLAAALAIALGLTTLRAQVPQAPQERQPSATFRSAIDLVPVDVNIIDRTGRPVTGLEATDFTLTIDGKARKVASAQYISAGDTAPAPSPTYYSSNTSAAGGRLIMIVVDQGNIGAGRGKLALDAASRFIGRLSPADRVALVAIPGAGPQIDFTANHATVQTLLPKMIGHATTLGVQRVGLAEAVAVQRGDPTAMEEILDRECSGIRNAAEIQDCTERLTVEANMVFNSARERTRNSLTALRSLIERLSATPTPKTILFLSEGIVLEQDLAELAWLGPAAARGQVVLYVLHLDTPTIDMAASRDSPSRSSDLTLGEEGLSLMAGLTRGSLFRVVGTADNAFTRVGLEISGYYLLSFAPEPGDRDGKPHKIKVEVPGRKGVEIRSRSQFSVEPASAVSEEAALAATLRAPLLATEIGLKLSTYTLRDAATGKLRILLAADIDRSSTSSGRLALAYTVIDSRGRLIGSQIDQDVNTPVRPATRTQTYAGSLLTDAPGVHTVKLAVVDSAGKRGSVEHTFTAQMASAGQIRVTDLLLAENTGSIGAGGLVPAVAGDFTSDTLHGYVELYSEVEEPLKNASVVVEVAESETGPALDGATAQIQPPAAAAPLRRTAEAAVTIALLPPGEYLARAVISIGGRKAGMVTRPFRIARPITSLSSTGRPAIGSSAAIPFTSRIDAFDRATVLAPQVVGFFIDRVNVGAAAAATAPAMEHARAGRFDAALEAMPKQQNEQLAAVFVSGLALYSKGQLEPAAARFREALRLDSEFFPAAFYLGSCYAAGGRDREAVGAWQTALVTESDAPFIYTLLGDALLRLRDAQQAVDILKEASALWPDNEQVQLRLGTAYAMAEQPTEALAVLEPYLTRHPEDHERLFVALRVLYESRAAGKPVKSAAEDRALFDKLAAAYTKAAGPQLALVEQWRKFMEK